MSLKRITISVPEEIAAKAQRAAEAGQVESVSAYFARLAAREPDWAEAEAVLDEMIAEAGGLTEEARAWARSVLGNTDTGIVGAARGPLSWIPVRSSRWNGVMLGRWLWPPSWWLAEPWRTSRPVLWRRSGVGRRARMPSPDCLAPEPCECSR
jgi:hypothetical protein